MKKFLIATALFAIAAVPVGANAANQCRSQATGKFAKCGTPGAVPASQYVKKGKAVAAKPAMTKPAMTPAKAAAAKPAKPSLLSKMKAKAKAKH